MTNVKAIGHCVYLLRSIHGRPWLASKLVRRWHRHVMMWQALLYRGAMPFSRQISRNSMMLLRRQLHLVIRYWHLGTTVAAEQVHRKVMGVCALRMTFRHKQAACVARSVHHWRGGLQRFNRVTLAEHIGLLQSQKMANETQLTAFSSKQTVQVAGFKESL